MVRHFSPNKNCERYHKRKLRFDYIFFKNVRCQKAQESYKANDKLKAFALKKWPSLSLKASMVGLGLACEGEELFECTSLAEFIFQIIM